MSDTEQENESGSERGEIESANHTFRDGWGMVASEGLAGEDDPIATEREGPWIPLRT